MDRRRFLLGALGASGALAATARWGGAATAGAIAGPHATGYTTVGGVLPLPQDAGFDHVVLVMMENRSFDHFLGWLPGADGMQSGLSYKDSHGVARSVFHETQFNGCGFNDPDHSYGGGRAQWNQGAMDGFLADPSYDQYAIGYYTRDDRPFMGALAQSYTVCDRYFCSILGPTYPNRFFQHAAATDRLVNTTTASTLPTIWDRLNQPGGPTGRYYYGDIPFLALWGTAYLPISSPYERFLADAAAGTLPNVSFVDPRFLGEGQAVSNDDHPAADIRAGDALLSEIFHAVSSGPAWSNTLLVINYDEWGGFYDHVPPTWATPGVPGIDTVNADANGNPLLGFRVPCIIASPFSTGGVVDHHLFDHTSVLKLIEWRWGLRPLSHRDASTLTTDPANLALALNLSAPANPTVPSLPSVAVPPPPVPCAPGLPVTAAADETWTSLLNSGRLRSWPLGM